MKGLVKMALMALMALMAMASLAVGAADTNESMTFVPIADVRIKDGFWSPRFELWRMKTIPDVFDKLDQRSHAVSNFVLAASGARTGHLGCWFYDGLLFEAIRGASDYLLRFPSPELDSRLDGLVKKIAAAQMPDGYLNTRIQIETPTWRWGDAGGNLLEQHELYNAGCLIEAGVHHYRATGKTTLLAAAMRFANCLCDTIGPRPKRNLLPGHSLPEAALVDLARLCRGETELAARTGVPTRPDDYLRLVKFWFEAHGINCGEPDVEKLGLSGENSAMEAIRRMTKEPHDAGWRPSWGDYMMDRRPLSEYNSIEGHAVRAVLLCEGLADYSCVTGDAGTTSLAERFWKSMVGRKLYLTGGVGADPKFESFSPDWVLPPDAYLETCAAVGNAFFSARMAALTGDGRYMDEFERVIYNALLTAVGQDGVSYTYQNPLNTAKGSRWDWHDCPCCPPMFLKLTGALPGYVYSTGRDGVSVNLFIGSSVSLRLPRGKLALRQTTAYPDDGRMELVIDPEKPFRFPLRVRVPGWARGIENPFGLYRSGEVSPYCLTVNGKPVAAKIDRGYAVVDRLWREGDRVALTLDVSPRRIHADECVEALRGKVACARGPVVMAVEELDDPTYSSFEKAIPYWQVANRGACGHRVWLNDVRDLSRAADGSFDPASFRSPGDEHRPETWFHLIGGNVSKAGLDADLDAVKEAGFGGIHLFHGQLGENLTWPGVTNPIPCLSTDWDDLVTSAADGCARRGLTFKMQNCPGWSMSGGPWITQDRAMRNLTYSRLDVQAGAHDIELPAPTWQMETDLDANVLDYRDLFVLAFPTPEGDDDRPLSPTVVSERDENGVMTRVLDFGCKQVVRSIELPSPSCMNHDWSYRPDIHVSLFALDGERRTKVLSRVVPQGCWQDLVPLTIACGETASRFWEVRLAHRHALKSSSVVFRSCARMDNWEGLAGWTLRGLCDEAVPPQGRGAHVQGDQILDLTDRFKNGMLAWTAPSGRWTVLRIGHVNNGMRNGPAPAEATGWECDKLDGSGIELNFDSYVGRLVRGPLKGNKLKGIVVDSWECRRQTWSKDLEKNFERACGYPLRKKLPCVFGWIVDTPESTDTFLHDWRRTLGDLIDRNYYARLSELAREQGLTVQYETAFGDVVPGDLLRYWKYCDTPMCEFWYPRTESFVGQDDFKPVFLCASAAHVYGKTRVAAEAFTTMDLRWDEDPKRLKATANHAFARGVTHLVFHTYTHNPQVGWKLPGTSFGTGIGTPFVRGQTWWKHMRAFTDWAARCELLLEAGKPVHDVLVYLGEECGHKPQERSPLPKGYKCDYLNRDALLTRISVRDGQFASPESVRWKTLWAPWLRRASKEVLERLSEFKAQGGRVVFGSADDAVKGLKPDLVVGPDETGRTLADWRRGEELVEWIHRRDDNSDWYFVAANGLDSYRGTLTFRATGNVRIMDPVKGSIRGVRSLHRGDGLTSVPIDLASGEGVFVVFDRRRTGANDTGDRHAEETASIQCDGWSLSFPQGWGAPSSLSLSDLGSWTDLPISEEGRSFSGTATYQTKFVARADMNISIDLGEVETIADVFLNDRPVRTLWCSPYRCDLSGLLSEGVNTLRIDVTSTWHNRLVYDSGLPECERKTWTIAAPKRGTPLKPSGLLGPVRFLCKR